MGRRRGEGERKGGAGGALDVFDALAPRGGGSADGERGGRPERAPVPRKVRTGGAEPGRGYVDGPGGPWVDQGTDHPVHQCLALPSRATHLPQHHRDSRKAHLRVNTARTAGQGDEVNIPLILLLTVITIYHISIPQK